MILSEISMPFGQEPLYRPEGAKGLSLGFYPGNTSTRCPALPVRRSSGMRDEGGKGRKVFGWTFRSSSPFTFATPIYCPFSTSNPLRGVQFGLGASN